MTEHYHLSKEDLIQHLRDQVALLSDMGERFDGGAEMYALPLATGVRTLVADTSKQSKSVLGQLKMKDRLGYIDTADPIIPENLVPTLGLYGIRIRSGPTTASVTYEPRCSMPGRSDPASFARKGFDAWWTDKVTKDAQGTLFSREDYVMHVATQAGGAHVQATLPKRYAALSRENSLAWRVGTIGGEEQDVDANPMLAGVRQIGWELEMTVRQQLVHWVGAPKV